MAPKLIRTDADYQAALARIEEVMDAEPGSPEGEELDLLGFLVERYEDEAFPMELPDPVEAMRFRMEQADLQQKDLVPYIGSASKVSEVLSGKRKLSLAMIRRLHQGLGIPAEVLLREPNASLPETPEGLDWPRFPITELARRGWFPGFSGTVREAKEYAEELMRSLLRPLQSADINAAMQRQNVRAGSQQNRYALLAWYARVAGLAEAMSVEKCQEGTPTDAFMRSLVGLSGLDKGPVLAREFLAKAGIMLVVERHLPRTHLDGASFKLNSDQPVVALTLRYDRLDNFWFTLCHELGHLALHLTHRPQSKFFDDLRADAGDDETEKQADRFAEDSLVPPQVWDTRCHGRRLTGNDIQVLARELALHPAIIAGRIRREAKNYMLHARVVGKTSVRKLFGV